MRGRCEDGAACPWPFDAFLLKPERCHVLAGVVCLSEHDRIRIYRSVVPGELGSREILDIVESYTDAYELLDAYDREAVPRPKGERSTYVLDYDECMSLIAQMRPRFASDIFGREKDDSFRSSIAAIYQSFGGEELYPSLEEKETMVSLVMNFLV